MLMEVQSMGERVYKRSRMLKSKLGSVQSRQDCLAYDAKLSMDFNEGKLFIQRASSTRVGKIRQDCQDRVGWG